MKTIRYLFYMMLLLSNIEVLRGSYSIDSLLDYLEEKGYYDIIQTVKIYFGDVVAINVCIELAQTYNCEEVVRVYMTDSGSGDGGRHKKTPPPIHINTFGEEILEYFENKYNINEEMRELIELILIFYDSLLENMNEEEIIDFIERIITKNRNKLNIN